MYERPATLGLSSLTEQDGIMFRLAKPLLLVFHRKPPKEITEVAILSQADLFRDIGECLRVGIGKTGKQEGTPLEAIIYFVRETAGDTQAV